MPNISLAKMSVETRRQSAGNARHKDKVVFRLAASLNSILPCTQIHWESWGHLPAFHVPQHVLGGAGTGQHVSLSSASPTELELTCTEPEGIFCSPYVAFQLASFAFKVLSFLPLLKRSNNCHSMGTKDWISCGIIESVLSSQENGNPNSRLFSKVNKCGPQIL